MRGALVAALLLHTTFLTTPAPPPPAPGTPFTAERLVQKEAFGAMQLSDDGHWLVAERQGPYDGAAAYALGQFTTTLIKDLLVIDATGVQPDRVIGRNDDDGYEIGPFSPDGRRMVVYRQRDRVRDFGILDLATLGIRWIDATPELPITGQTLAWRNDEEIILIAPAVGDQPIFHRLSYGTQQTLSQRWRTQQAGREPSVTQIWSGPDIDRRARRDPARLLRVRARDGAVETLLTAELFDLALSPDGRTVALLSNEGNIQPAEHEVVYAGTPISHQRLTLLDLDTGRSLRPLANREVLGQVLQWSPDGDAVLVYGRDQTASWEEGEVVSVASNGGTETVDLRGLRPAILRTPSVKAPLVRVSWSHGRPAVLVKAADGTDGWLITSGSGHDGELLPASSTFARRASGDWTIGDDGMRSADGGSSAQPVRAVPGSMVSNGARQRSNPNVLAVGRRAVVDADNCLRAEPDQVAVACLEHAPDIVSANAETAAWTEVDAQGVSRLKLHTAAGVRLISTVNADLAQVTWPTIREIRHIDRGAAVSSWLLVPPGREPDGGWPLIVQFYPGENYKSAPGDFVPGSSEMHLAPLVFASAGYAVLSPALPLAAREPAGQPDLSDRLWNAVDAAAGVAPIDTDRVAAMGHSFGGWGAFNVAEQTHRFRAVVSSLGRVNLAADMAGNKFNLVHPEDGVWTNIGPVYYQTGQGNLGALPWEDPDLYVRSSPIFAVGRISTPVYIVATDLDDTGSQAMFGALYRRAQDASFVTYWGETHVFYSPANVIDLHTRILEWLAPRMAPRSSTPSATAAHLSPDADPGVSPGGS